MAERARRGRTAPRWRLADLSLDDRIARGRAARRGAPRSGHARWEPAPGRPDPVALLQDQAATRVPELVPIRYGRMLVSPGTFYRGGALIMASDLAATPRSGITVQLCGDAHLSNFGVFASPERQLIFDINDFDETLPGLSALRLAACTPGPRYGLRPTPAKALTTTWGLASPRHSGIATSPGSTISRPSK